MDVNFVLVDGRSFTIEVDYFDTVLNIKEKIQMCQGIPVSKQTFKINEEILQDEDDVDKCAILDNCSIQLIVASDSEPAPARTVQLPTMPQLQTLQSSPPLPQMQMVQSLPPLPQLQTLQSSLPLPPLPQLQTMPTLLQLQTLQSSLLMPQIKTLPTFPKLQTFQSLPQTLQSLPQLPQLQSLPPLPQLQSLPPLPQLQTGQSLSQLPTLWPVTRKQSSQQVLPRRRKRSYPPVTLKQSSPPRTKIHVQLRTPSSTTHLPVDVNDSVLRLKQRIQAMEGKEVHKMVIHATGAELHDQQLLSDCGVLNNSDIDVTFRQPPPNLSAEGSSGGVGSSSANKLKLKVLIKEEIEVLVEVNASENLTEFRKELERLHEELQFDLPKDGRYFFIHNQEVMWDDKSFDWHQVADGDTIDVFPGFVTGGEHLNIKETWQHSGGNV